MAEIAGGEGRIEEAVAQILGRLLFRLLFLNSVAPVGCLCLLRGGFWYSSSPNGPACTLFPPTSLPLAAEYVQLPFMARKSLGKVSVQL